jgi:hypothetical protein
LLVIRGDDLGKRAVCAGARHRQVAVLNKVPPQILRADAAPVEPNDVIEMVRECFCLCGERTVAASRFMPEAVKGISNSDRHEQC